MLCYLCHLSLVLLPTPKADSPLRRVRWGAEMFFTLVYIVDLKIYFDFFGLKHSIEKGWAVARAGVLFLTLLDLVIQMGTGFRSYRFARILRPFIVILRR